MAGRELDNQMTCACFHTAHECWWVEQRGAARQVAGPGRAASPQPPQASALTSASLTTHCNMPAAVSREAMAESQGAVPLPPSACPCSLNQSPEDDCRWPAVDSCRVGVEGGGAGVGPQG